VSSPAWFLASEPKRSTPLRRSWNAASSLGRISVLISSLSMIPYSTVTLFARFRGWSTSAPRRTPMK
jgi:hypothetical protein